MRKKKALIVSDGKKGHLNQAIAYCKLKDMEFEIIEIEFKNRFFKLLAYLFDPFSISTYSLFKPFPSIPNGYDEVVAVGSSTYYIAKLLAKELNIKATALNYPKGFVRGFDTIYSPFHDRIRKKGVKEIPINFASLPTKKVYSPKKKCVGLIVGGDNKVFKLKKERLEEVVKFIFTHFKGYEKAVSTSPRTSKEIEEWLEMEKFDYKVIYSKTPINPLGDFVRECEVVFITIDSTSMISEAVSGGKSAIEVIMLDGAEKENKYLRLVKELEKEGCLHLFDGKIAYTNKKIDLRKYL
ncbi:MAG: hypothetical protein GXO61_02045 [Epsilonproteobacteria bacterium]|nr:hypothetical protein [Campylobacterota bacterium]